MKAQRATFRAKNVGIVVIVAMTMLISGLAVIPTAQVNAQGDIGGEFGGDYKVAINEQPNTLNPLNPSANESAQRIIDLLYDSLGRIDPYSLEIIPWVAKEWVIDANNQSVVTVTLKKDVLWHDSSPVTVQDINYTFGPNGYNINYISGTVLDPANNSITFHLNAPTALFYSQILQMKLIPAGFNLTSSEHGCGPYYLDEVVTANGRPTWMLAAFEDYFVGRPYLDNINMIYYHEGIWSNASKTGAGYDLLNGTIDFIGWDLTSNDTASTLIDIQRPSGNTSFLENPDEKNVSVYKDPGFEYYYLGMNNNQSHLLNNVEMRKAIAHCIDKAALTNFDISGGLIIADSIMNPLNMPWFNTSINKFDFDINEANSILFNAGFLDIDDDGFRELPNRTDFSFELLIPPQTEYFNAKAYGDLISGWLNSTGINTTVVEMSQANRTQRIFNNNFDLFLEQETRAKIDPFFLYDMFHSSKIGGSSDTNQLNFIGRAREIQGVVSVNNTTMVGKMNHTNIFNDGSANIEAYRNGEIWGKAVRQPVWTSNGSLPVTLDLKNTSINSGYYVYMNRTVSEFVWDTSLTNTAEQKANSTGTHVPDDWLAAVNTTFHHDIPVNASPRTTVLNESVGVNYSTPGPSPSNLTNRPVETGTLHMWKNGTVKETVNFVNVGTRNVLIVDADNLNDGLAAFYNSSLNNNGITDAYTWDVYGTNKGFDEGKPTATDMAPYNLVIWIPTKDMTGNLTLDPLTVADETEIGSYLSGGIGRNFLLSNTYYSYTTDGGSASYSAGDFAYDYLGVGSVTQSSFNEFSVEGVVGDTVFDGFGPAVQDWSQCNWGGFPLSESDEISAGNGILCTLHDGGIANGIRYDSGFKTIFFGFPFETLLSADADDAMGRMLDWFIPPGYEAQLSKGVDANENILTWGLYNLTGGGYLQNVTDYTLDQLTGLIETSKDYTAFTILANYTYTRDLQETVDYNISAWGYWNGKVNITVNVNAANDTVKANYVRYNESTGGSLAANITSGWNIINNYTLYWSKGGTPTVWPGSNYTLNNVTGLVTFTQPLGAGEMVKANFSCFDPTHYGINTLQLEHGAGDESIYSPNFVLKRNDVANTSFSLDGLTGGITLTFTLSYDDNITSSYWYYSQSSVISTTLFALSHGAPANEAITNFMLNVTNSITGGTQFYEPEDCGANLDDGTFYWNMSAGEILIVTYSYYDPASIVYQHYLGNTNVVPGTFSFYKNGIEITIENYTINWVSGIVVLNQSNISLLPTDNLTAAYSFLKNLTSGIDFSFTQASGSLVLTANVQKGDLVLADYTYATYTMLNNEAGTIQIITNFNASKDNLTMSFDYRKFDELIELFDSQMDQGQQALYVKEAQAFIAEMAPCVPLFSSKVANALNNTRYDGFVSTIGGRINFWTYVNLRNIVVGEMQVFVKAQENFMTENEQATLEIRIEDLDGNTVPDAEITFDGEGTYGNATFDWDDTNGNGVVDSDETGIYEVEYTAPSTTISRTVIIQATAIRPSFVKGTGEIQMTIHPKIQQFNIEIMRGAAGETVTSIDSGNETAVRIIVTDKDTGSVVTNAQVSLSISPLGLGGYLNATNGTTDSTGTFETVFGAINVTIDTTFAITAAVSRTGYIDGSQTTSISVYRDPNIEAPGRGFLGLPAPSLIVILILLAGLSIMYARRKKR